MPTVKVVDLIKHASMMLTDIGNTRWSSEDLLAWFNLAQKALVGLRPDTCVVNGQMDCTAGPKQSIPSDGIRLTEVISNVSGESVTEMSRLIMDRHVPGWMKANSSNIVEHYVSDERDPKRFYVYPPAAGDTTKLVILYTKSPDKVEIDNFDTDETTIEVDDEWEGALIEYMLYRAWVRDSDALGNIERASTHFNNFRAAVGESTQASAAMDEDPR